MKEYVSLTTAAMKMGKRHFHSDHSSSWVIPRKIIQGMSPLPHGYFRNVYQW